MVWWKRLLVGFGALLAFAAALWEYAMYTTGRYYFPDSPHLESFVWIFVFVVFGLYLAGVGVLGRWGFAASGGSTPSNKSQQEDD